MKFPTAVGAVRLPKPVLALAATFAFFVTFAGSCGWGGYDSAHKSEGACASSLGTVQRGGCVWEAAPPSDIVQLCMKGAVAAYPELDDTVTSAQRLARSCGAGVSPGVLYGWLLD